MRPKTRSIQIPSAISTASSRSSTTSLCPAVGTTSRWASTLPHLYPTGSRLRLTSVLRPRTLCCKTCLIRPSWQRPREIAGKTLLTQTFLSLTLARALSLALALSRTRAFSLALSLFRSLARKNAARRPGPHTHTRSNKYCIFWSILTEIILSCRAFDAPKRVVPTKFAGGQFNYALFIPRSNTVQTPCIQSSMQLYCICFVYLLRVVTHLYSYQECPFFFGPKSLNLYDYRAHRLWMLQLVVYICVCQYAPSLLLCVCACVSCRGNLGTGLYADMYHGYYKPSGMKMVAMKIGSKVAPASVAQGRNHWYVCVCVCVCGRCTPGGVTMTARRAGALCNHKMQRIV